MCNVHRNLLMANSAETVKSLAAIYIFSKLSAFRSNYSLIENASEFFKEQK